MNPESKNCQNCKSEFTIEVDDFSFYEKMKVPAPTFCPECRFQRRCSWRNDTSLYSTNCSLCEKRVVSMYAPDSGMTIYCNKCWWSDKWDPYSYAVDYDFSRPFFEQYNELMHRVPHIALVNDDGISSIGCEYTGDCWFAKNCYMTFCAWKIENVMYGYFNLGGKDMMDCLYVLDTADWMYECINCDRGYKLKNSQLCLSCTDSTFLYDCRNCSDCFMSSGLRNKRYFYKNQQYSKQAYEEILASYNLDTFSGVEKAQKEFYEFILEAPRRFSQIYKSFNCTGEGLTNGKNAKDCFVGNAIENSRFVQHGGKNVDSYDVTAAGEHSESYEGLILDHSNHNFFGLYSVKSQNLEYTMHCHSSKYLFGCVGLKKGEYSVFNKRYTKDEYEKLIVQIREQMDSVPYIDKMGNVYKYGEFFPIELSPFGYNETVAPQFFPLDKDEAKNKNYNWQDNIQKTVGKQTVEIQNIPESINDINDEYVNEVFECMDCKRNYKMIPEELRFYKVMNIPIPRRCFYCRFDNRLKRRNPFKLWHRSCMKENCQNEFETTYAPGRPEIIYCEKCYQQEVV